MKSGMARSDKERHRGRGRLDHPRRDLAPAAARQPVNHNERQATDQDLRPEREADKPSRRCGFGVEQGGDDQEHGRPGGADQGGVAHIDAAMIAAVHWMCSAASGTSAAVARRDSCSARI